MNASDFLLTSFFRIISINKKETAFKLSLVITQYDLSHFFKKLPYDIMFQSINGNLCSVS